jgi:hypothetical protein
MSLDATRQADLFADPRAPAMPAKPEVDAAYRAQALALMTRELEEVEASPDLPCKHDTSRAMGKEMSFKGRLWLLHVDDAARLLARWEAAWAAHWERWEAEP